MIHNFRLLALGCLLALTTSGIAAAADEPDAHPPLTVDRLMVDRPDERIGVLSNGLTMILKVHRTAPVATARMYCRTGSVYEQEFTGAGISHLFEHLLHGGETKSRTEDQSKQILAQLGDNTNAYTSFSITSYFINTTDEKITTAIDLLSDWITHPTFPQAPFEREWGVVQRELERDVDDPSQQAFYQLLDTMYLRSPTRFPVIGYQQAVQSLTKDDIVSYYHRMYVPDNIVVVVVGDIELDEAQNAIARAFADFKRRPVPTIALPQEPPMVAPRLSIKHMQMQGAVLQLAWPTIPLIHPDLYALDVLSYILTEGESSRLVRHIVREQKLTYTIDSFSWTPEWADGVFSISARLDPDKIEAAKEAILKQIATIQQEGVTGPELEQAKQQKAAEQVFGNQTAEQIADTMARDYIATGDAHFSDAYVARIQELTPEQIQDVAERYLQPQRLATMMILPHEQPAPGAAAPLAETEPVRELTFDNGLRVLLRRDTASPIVAVQLFCLGGLLVETPKTSGLSNIAADLMLRGTETRSADEIARFFDSRGASITAASGSNTVYLRTAVMKKDLDDALPVIADIVLHPTFPADELDRLRPRILDAIRRVDEQWRSQLDAYFRERFFGKGPYAMLPIGSREAVESFTAQEVRDFYRQWLTAPNAVLSIYGDFDPAHVEARVRDLFADMSTEHVDVVPAQATAPAVDAPTLYIKVASPERDVAGIYIGYPGMRVTDVKDRYPMAVLDTIMSGYRYPSGWLFDELRGGDRDLVYEVHALNFLGVIPGYFGAYAACQPDRINEVYKIMIDAFDRARDGRFTDDELASAKGIILTTDLLGSQTNSERGMDASLDELYGLGFDYRDHLADYVNSVTLDDVRRVAKKYLTQPVITIVTPKPDDVSIGITPAAIDGLAEPKGTTP